MEPEHQTQQSPSVQRSRKVSCSPDISFKNTIAHWMKPVNTEAGRLYRAPPWDTNLECVLGLNIKTNLTGSGRTGFHQQVCLQIWHERWLCDYNDVHVKVEGVCDMKRCRDLHWYRYSLLRLGCTFWCQSQHWHFICWSTSGWIKCVVTWVPFLSV